MEKLFDYLKTIYNKEEMERIMTELSEYAKTLQTVEKKLPEPHWYKFINLYFTYPDGVLYDKKISFINNLSIHLEYIKNLQCNAVHLLPFFESPQVDRGFDISNHFKIDKRFGTMDDMRRFIKLAEKMQLRLFMDFVVNHVSDQHEWFKKAQEGDEKYRNFFIYTKKRPQLIRTYKKNNVFWAEYKEGNKNVSACIVFPERKVEIPHWTQGKDGYWYYHTFYPEQLDLNWFNPDVFIAMSKVLMYWASFGFNFRIDAILWIGQGPYKQIDEKNQTTHLLIAALKCIAEIVNEESVFIAESYEKLDTVISYFGDSNRIESNLSYNFHLCTNVWVSLIKKDATYIWNKLNLLYEIPKHAEWVSFLRNHDELSLSYLSPQLTKEVNEELASRGMLFRGKYGISGRTFSFLERRVRRFLMAYFLLVSFPGGIAIPYGDEIGKTNIPYNKLADDEKHDTRNINRGFITPRAMKSSQGAKIYKELSSILENRKKLREYMNVWPIKIDSPQEVFGAKYILGTSELLIYINLSNRKRTIKGDFKSHEIVTKVNNAQVNHKKLILGAYAGIWLQK